MSEQSRIRLAIVGAGIFARIAHLPALKTLDDTFEIVAVCSRTRASAANLASEIGGHVDVESDLDALLARDDIDAVDIIMPIDSMPAAVRKALRAGKHVVSEKPVSPTVAVGRELLAESHAGVWMVAENCRYSEAFELAATLVARGDLGEITFCNWTIAIPMEPSNRYYNTAWRRDNSFPGGFLLDGGVHQAAAMRMIIGEIAGVSAEVHQFRSDLPPADTLVSSLRFARGTLGSYNLTLTSAELSNSGLMVFGDQGSLHVTEERLEVTRNGQTETHDFVRNTIERELAGFAAAIRDGLPHRNSAAEALNDVAVIEAILRSSEHGERIGPERSDQQ